MKTILQSVLDAIGGYFSGVFKGLIGHAAVSLEAAVVEFVKTDVGHLALDAVSYASTLTGQSNQQLRDAARTKLIADLKAAGKDAATIAESQLNLFIEMAYTAYKSHLV